MPVCAVTRNSMRRRVAALFAFAKEKKWRAENPFAGGKRAEVKRQEEPRKKVRILNAAKAAALLEIATDETRPFWAIVFFAGLRPESELCRLQWQDIDFEQRVIVVDGSASELEETRTGRRVVRMSDNLIAWLQLYAQPEGPVAPPGDTWFKLRADKRKIGIGTPGRETPEEQAAGIKLQPWTPDITRHTYGSHLLADCGDIGIVSTQIGNSPQMVRRHYLALVKPSDAARFWSLRPAFPSPAEPTSTPAPQADQP